MSNRQYRRRKQQQRNRQKPRHNNHQKNKSVLKGCYVIDNRITKEQDANESEIVTPIIYTDGSYMQNVDISSYGYAVELNGEIIQKDFGLIMDKDMLALQSIGAELYACLRAIEWAIANRYSVIYIVYDCEGIVQTIQSKHTKKHRGKEKFTKLIELYSQHVKICFKRTNNEHLYKQHRLSHHLSRSATEILIKDR